MFDSVPDTCMFINRSLYSNGTTRCLIDFPYLNDFADGKANVG